MKNEKWKTVLDPIKANYTVYVKNYQVYLKRRGYGDHTDDGYYFFRAFLQCWAQPGFHRFWWLWNPGLGYFTFKIYRVLGGNRRRQISLIGTFTASGLIHSVIVLPFLGWSFVIPVTFLGFGIFVCISDLLNHVLKQYLWPFYINILANVSLVLLCFNIGFSLNRFIYRSLIR
jgi:hypothetical protein